MCGQDSDSFWRSTIQGKVEDNFPPRSCVSATPIQLACLVDAVLPVGTVTQTMSKSFALRMFATQADTVICPRVRLPPDPIPLLSSSPASPKMPKIRTSRTKQPPEGFEDIENVSAAPAPSLKPKHAQPMRRISRSWTTMQRR